MDDLQTLLGQLQEGPIESSGRFSLDLRKARDKLRQYQLKEPCFYLLKLVQAGVSAGAHRIDLYLARREVRVFIVLPSGNPLADSSELLQLLSDPQSASPGPLRHLAIGLNSSWALKPEWVGWSYWPSLNARGWGIRIDAEEIHYSVAPPRPWDEKGFKGPQELKAWKDVDIVEFSMARDASPASFIKNAASEHMQIMHRCAFCPVPLFLGGRRLIGQWSPPSYNGQLWMGGPYYLSERFVLAASGFRICAPPWSLLKPALGGRTLLNSKEFSGDLQPRYPTFAHQFEGEEKGSADTLLCRCALALPSNFEGLSRLVIVKHGVTLQPIHLSEKPFAGTGVQVLIASDQVSTDISEFSAIPGAAVEECRRFAAAQLSHQVNELHGMVGQLTHHYLDDKERGDNEWIWRVASLVFVSLKAGSATRREYGARFRESTRIHFQRILQEFNAAQEVQPSFEVPSPGI